MGNQYLTALETVFEELQSIPVGRLYVAHVKQIHDSAAAEFSRMRQEIGITINNANQDKILTPKELNKIRADAMDRFIEAEREFKSALEQINNQNQALIQDPTDTEPDHDSTFPIYTTNVAGTKLLQKVAILLKDIQNCIEDQILPDPTLANDLFGKNPDVASGSMSALTAFIDNLFVSFSSSMSTIATDEVLKFIDECKAKIVDILERKINSLDVEINQETDDTTNLTASDMLAFFQPLTLNNMKPLINRGIETIRRDEDGNGMKLKGTPAKQKRTPLNPSYNASDREMSHYRIDIIRKYQLPVFNFLRAIQKEEIFTDYKNSIEKLNQGKSLKNSEKNTIHMITSLVNYIKEINYNISKIFYIKNSYKESFREIDFLLTQISAVKKSISSKQTSFSKSTNDVFLRLESSLEALTYYIKLCTAEGTLKYSETAYLEQKTVLANHIDLLSQDISTLIYNQSEMQDPVLLVKSYQRLCTVESSLASLEDKDSQTALALVKEVKSEMFKNIDPDFILSISPPEELEAVPSKDSGCDVSPTSISEAPSPAPVTHEQANEPNQAVILKYPKPMRAEKQTARADTPNRPATPTQHLTATAPA